MIHLLEKKSFKHRLQELKALNEEELQEYMAREIENAYWAGYVQFNGLTNTIKNSFGKQISFYISSEEIPVVGPDSMLASLYSQAKGFKK